MGGAAQVSGAVLAIAGAKPWRPHTPSIGLQRWARVPPGLAWKRPGLPRDWVRVLQKHPEGTVALPGYVWLETSGKVLHAAEHMLEFSDGRPD
jgi:hypothetical protein